MTDARLTRIADWIQAEDEALLYPPDAAAPTAPCPDTFVQLRAELHAGRLSAWAFIAACLVLDGHGVNPVTGRPLTLEELGT